MTLFSILELSASNNPTSQHTPMTTTIQQMETRLPFFTPRLLVTSLDLLYPTGRHHPPPFICGVLSYRKRHLFLTAHTSTPTPTTIQPAPAAPTPQSTGIPYNMSSRLACHTAPFDHASLPTTQLSLQNGNRPETLLIPPRNQDALLPPSLTPKARPTLRLPMAQLYVDALHQTLFTL